MHIPGGADLIVIFVLALLLFGPDKLPDLARTIGKGVREIRKVTSEVKNQFNFHDEE